MYLNRLMNVVAALCFEHGSGVVHDGIECLSLSIPNHLMELIETGQIHVEVWREDGDVHIKVVHDRKGRGYDHMMEVAREIMGE